MARVFSGIQPTGGGVPHLGNYLGALKGYVKLQKGNEALYCVVDQHATTVRYDFRNLREHSRVTAAALRAIGIDDSKAVVFKQSAVPEHAQLALVLGHIASLGPLERMTQFKEKGRSTEDEQRDSIGLGLLTYPVLMAADILLYKADLVPVGGDQHQHLQMAGALAKRFNSRFKTDLFRKPRMVLQKGAARIMSLRNPQTKMSKSDPDPSGTIYLTDTVETAAKKFRSAVSDPDMLPSDVEGLDGRPAARNLIELLASMKERDVVDIVSEIGGQGFGKLKSRLTEAFEEHIAPIGHTMKIFLNAPDTLDADLAYGAERARDISRATLKEVYEKVGF